MSLIKENSQELFPKDPALHDANPKAESRIHSKFSDRRGTSNPRSDLTSEVLWRPNDGKVSERRGSCESSTDAEYERRRMEFAKRRIQKTRKKQHLIQAWLPDGYSQIFRLYVFGPSGFWTMASLRCAAKFDPFLSLDCAPRPPPWHNPRKGSIFAIWQP